MSHTIIPVEPFDYFVFGATGDLSRKKLIPALYHRFADGQIPKTARIIGCARTELDSIGFREMVRSLLKQECSQDASMLDAFLSLLIYQAIDVYCDEDWLKISNIVNDRQEAVITVFYLSVGPTIFEPIIRGLEKNHLHLSSRLVLEKPLGFDLSSSVNLNNLISSVFDEDRIYRIDHYLGKETVQNLMALRFANAMFEPLWNSHYIDHVQITAAETVGVEGRGEYYDQAGALRDMVQNHLLQLLCLSAMEPPSEFDANSVRDEKLKVLKSLKPLSGKKVSDNTVRAQYAGDKENSSYLQDANKKYSLTESYVALRVDVDNWRWAGTPFYLRTGKRLKDKMMEIAFVFRKAPHFIFNKTMASVQSNTLVIRLQPNEGIDIEITTKEPGHGGMRLHDTVLEAAKNKDGVDDKRPDAYQRLLLDVVRGDQTLFMRGDEVEAAWAWVDPIIESWNQSDSSLDYYSVLGEGPASADELLKRSGRSWRKIQ
ncbi:MAG: glucose-6-phosphate dehydrogenase [Cellvibrionaceae bacterium]